MSHDQNFKNLILDYPRESIHFFAACEAQAVDAGARILPIRAEQLKERLGERFRELDVPVLVEWPDGRRAALLFVFEEETDPARFSIHRLAHYCLSLAELYGTDRVVPVVIFLHPGGFATRLTLGSEAHRYLDFHYIACALKQIRARDHLASRNLVARLNLPNMAYEEQGGAAAIGPFHQQGDVELAKAFAQALLELFLADGQDARPGVDGLGLDGGEEADGLVRIVDDEVFEVVVVAHG